MTSHTKLMEVFLIVIWVCFIVNFSFGDVIISKCNEDCSIQLKDVPDKDLFCNKECKLIQCHSGCKSYYRAVNSSCQTVCSESYKKDGTSLQQTERQFCTQGCSYGLFLYTNNIKSLLGVLDAPELKKDSKGYSSLTLHWNAPISSNVTYFIQSRELDTNGDWLTYSSLQPNGDIQITGLQPYITYKFRVSVVISTNDVSYTQESENITTLPHGVPASPPTITEISAPTSSVISLSWKQPTYTNGPLLCYKLRLEPLNNKELHETNIEVPANVTSWTFRQLTSSQEYLVSISAWNQAGEGQFDTTNMTTPGSGNLSKEDIPYLILAEDNQVILQDMTDVIIKGPDTLHITQTQIKGIAAHVRKQLILCSDSTGKVSQINMEDKVVTEDIYPSLGHPGAMTIDWLHNYTYIVDGFMIKRCDLDRPTCIMATVMLPSQPTVIQVDPINGYLFFNQGSTNMGLYAIDIGEITPSGPANHFLLVRFEVNAFSIDLNNMQIYFPNNSMNTIMSSFLDGSSVSNVRKSGNVVRPNYYQISSLVYSNGVFFFTNGSKVLFEEYNTVKEAFYLNEMLLFGTHYSSLNVYQQMTQPHPVPHSPPQNVRALFSDQRVYIQWRRPKTLVYQGKGAWHTWFYEICLYQDDGTENEIFEKVSGSFLEVENLVPNTTYEIKVRAWSLMGSGPWSDVFVGRTLTLDATTAKVIVAATQSESRGIVYEIDMNGRHVNNLTTLSFWERQLIDLTWSDNMIFWVSNFNKVFVYDRTIGQQREILHISDATSVAYDWLGQKLYWSNPVQNVIRRSDLGGHNEEYVIPGKARHMAIDAIQGRIYWVTMNTMEAAFLNGEDHIIYFSLPYFCGKHVISLTLNFDLRKVLWYVKSFERQELFMSDLLGNGITADQLAVQPLGSFISIAHFSVMQYFSHRLFWQNEQGSIVVGDIECNYTSEITVDPVSVFTVTHESLHPYPEGLDKSTLKIIPSEIQQSSIKCEGYWSSFNLTWQKAYTNHGKIFYEVSIQIKNDKNLAGHTTNNWMELRDIAAYTEITVTIRAYSYWGYGPVTVSKIHSPMSVPSQPLTPRVYITQHKESMTSENSLAADFRWTLPEHQNGIITHFIVYSWKSGDDDKKNTTSLPETARHFNLQCLKPSMTYFFQVSACTVIGCGPISELVSAEADAVNPVPKLLIVTSDHLMIEETDSAGNRTMILEPSISPITATYLAQDDRIFWINKNNVLMETNQHVQKKLLDLNGQVSDITIDWISRTLYIVETDTMESSSKIISYLLDQSTSVELLWRNSLIDSIVSDPLTSTIIWTEKKKGGATYSLYKLERDGKVTSMFSTVRGKRETTTCNCTSDFTPGRRLAVDHSQDKKMEIVFYDAVSNSVMASDLDGCYCRPLTSDLTNKGLPPDSLSVDHSHVYWYNKTEKLLYSLNKQSGGLTNRIMDDVKDIIAYGTHLQPLPSTECLDPNAYQGPVKVVHKTNQTITLELQPVAWPLSCDGISRPDTKYTLYYKSGTGTDSCGPSDAGCLIEFSYNNIVTLTSLQPYTSYIIHGAISNYYTEYLSEALSKPVIVTTLTGVPSKAVIKRVSGNTPEQVDISWSQPAIPNGPVTDLVYNIQYSTLTNDGLLKATKVYNSTSNKTPNQMSISELLPNHTYQFQVKTSNGKQKFFSISDPVTFRTFPTPNDIVLLSANQHSLSVTWKSPSDIIVFYKFQYQKCPYDSEMLGETVPSITIKNTTYNATFHDLQPFTDYCLRMVILYGKSYIWKGKSGFIFRTSSSVPDLPLPPRVETLSREVGYEVVWLEPKDNGEAINNYILQYWNDESQIWYDIFNGTETRWIIDNEILPPGKEYMFRVAAGNANGLGPFSFNSTVFTFTEFSKSTEDNIAIISIALSFLFVFLLVLLMAVCYVIRRKNRKKRKPKQFIAVGRGVDTELAILRDLPHTTQQQNNSLYSINLIPTNGDIANLPHFRRDQLMLTKFLGSGAFGEVFEGIAKNIISDSSGETKVAVKTLRKSASDHEKEEFLKEAVLMSHFKHDHILSLLGVCLDNDPQFIILELMEGGDLLSFLRTSRGLTPNASCLCLTDLVKICVHVARGCKYLEEMHFVHRDLAARNCLVSSKCPAEIAVKIGDFGLARDIYKNDYYRKEGEGLLPVRWMSPESLVDGVFTTQSDIWAFGVLMWEVMTFGQQPYQARTNIEVLHFVRACGQLDKPEHCPEELYLLMNGCWSYNTEDRITFSYILQQLEQFHEKCVTLLADYIMPVRTRPPAEAAGYQDNNSLHNNNNNNNKTNKRMTSSRGHDMSNHQAYNKIHRATSFDSPEPCDASSDYLHPQTNGTPTYLEILHDPVAQSSVPSGRKMSDSSSHGSVHEPVVRKQSQSSMQSARKMSESSSHGSVHEPVVRKSSQSSMQSARKLSECSSHCSLYEPVVRKTSRHNSTSSDIYGQVQFTGYSIISVPEEVLPQACAIGPDKLPAGLRIPDKITSQSVLRVPDEITSQSGHRVPDEITSQSGHRVPDEITSQSGHRVPDEITLQSGLGVPDEFTSQSGLHAPEKIPACSDDEEMQHNILSCQQNYEDILMNYDHVPPTNYVVKSCDQDDPSANNRKQSPVNHKHDSSHVNSVSNHINHNQNSCHNNQNHDLCFSPRLVPMNAESVALSQHNIHHNMSEPTFQMGHVRQYCHSVDKNNDFLLNYDHVPPQDPHLNYDYPSRLCIEEKFEKTNKHPHARNVNGKICYNSAENILSQEHKMYKNLEFTDNMNYVDCNRNRGSHSSLSPHSSPHIVYGGNLQYWTTNGIPGNSVVIRGPKSQIYPVSGKETLAATLV